MSAIERVMKAYCSKYRPSPAQAAFVRSELSDFIADLMARNRREPTMPSGDEVRPGLSRRPEHGPASASPSETAEEPPADAMSE